MLIVEGKKNLTLYKDPFYENPCHKVYRKSTELCFCLECCCETNKKQHNKTAKTTQYTSSILPSQLILSKIKPAIHVFVIHPPTRRLNHIFVRACLCDCVLEWREGVKEKHARTHTHTHTATQMVLLQSNKKYDKTIIKTVLKINLIITTRLQQH